MSTLQLEDELQKAERERIASERQIEANIRIKESIEVMEQSLIRVEKSVDALTRLLATDHNEKSALRKLERETLMELKEYLANWKR